MKGTNKYINRSKISETHFRLLLKYFVLDLTASQAAQLINYNRNTINRYYKLFRERITLLADAASPFVSIDDPRGASHFALFKKDESIYLHAIYMPKEAPEEFQPHLERLDPHIHAYIDMRQTRFYRALHAPANISGPEAFWSFAKTRLAKFNGLHASRSYQHLKECEFRYNNRNLDIYTLLLKEFRKNPLN